MSEEFARVYDALGLGQGDAALARLALGLAAEAGLRPTRSASLGCRTGAAALALAEAGVHSLGIDADAAMLHEAWARARRLELWVRWAQADIRDSQASLAAVPFFIGRCDLALLGGMVGQLLDDQMLARALATAAALLRPGGMLVCDLAAAETMRSWEQHDIVLRDDHDYLAFSSADYDPESGQVERRVVWFVREIATWWRGEIDWRERPWDDTELSAALEQAGFHNLRRLEREAGQGAAIVYVAERR